MSKQRENYWPQHAIRIFFNTASHPIEYAKVLIQIGHEPIAPVPGRSLFGKPALKLPNVFEYVRYIKSVDGFAGCYRGLVPKVCGSIAGAIASQKIVERMEKEEPDEEVDEDTLTEEELLEERKKTFKKNLKKDLISHTTAIIVSQPFYVVSIRMMAQFVGRETKYNGIFGSISEVYKQNGLSGFFYGLVPRMLGEIISLVLASSLTYLVTTFVIDDKELQLYTSSTMSFVASTLTYPFQVISSCMAVAGSGLAAGSPPHMPIYNSWTDCWYDLSKRDQLKRGSSVLIRYYVGPQVVISNKAMSMPSPNTARRFA